MRQQAETARAGFIARGFSPHAVTLLPATPAELLRRDTVLSAFRAVQPSVDETWLLLLGHVAMGRDSKPSFQLSGPRLSAGDLATAVGSLPGRTFIVLGTASSGGFLTELLALPNVEAVAATAGTGEINEPRFAQMWADALVAAPAASFRELAVEAAGRVQAFYQERRLGQGEHAQLINRASGKIIETPFMSPP